MPEAPHTREVTNGELVITFAVKRGPAVQGGDVRDLGQRVGAAGRVRGAACALRDGQPFSAARLDADVQTIEDLYRRRGFAAAKVRSAVEVVTADAAAGAGAGRRARGHHRGRAHDGGRA